MALGYFPKFRPVEKEQGFGGHAAVFTGPERHHVDAHLPADFFRLASDLAIDGRYIHGGAFSRIKQLCAALKRRI